MAFLFNGIVDWLILLSVLFWYFYYYSTKTYDYWKKKNVLFSEPIPLFGNVLNTVLASKHSSLVVMEEYKRFSGERFFGRFLFRKPVLVLRDPDLIELVLIKDFSHFYNRSIPFDRKLDKLSQHLVNLRDHKWKSLRNKLTPVFSSGKLKSMHQTLIDCSESLSEILNDYAADSKPFEGRDVMGNFTTEVIGRCAFGLNMNSLKNPDSEFRRMGKQVLKPTLKNGLRFILRIGFPRILSWLKWKGLSADQERFFTAVIKETAEAREKNKIEVNDFFQLLMHIRKEDKKKIEERGQKNVDDPETERK